MNDKYHDLLLSQKEYFNKNETKDVQFRINKLIKLKSIILEKDKEISNALKKDLNKGDFESFACEVMGVIDEINYAVKNLKKWAKPKKVKTPLTFFKASSYIYPEPYGNVLILTAWNYPFMLAFSPLVGAIAAGNCCIVKPSELAPNTSKIVKEIIEECFDKNHCAVIEGGVEETTDLLEERFDFIFYTGSTRVGKIIAKAAAKELTPVVLELGGKSPCIIDNTVDVELSAKRIAWGKFMNAGQTCVAPDYILIHKDVKESFINAMKKCIVEFYGENPEKSVDYGRIVNEKNYDRLVNYITKENVVSGGNFIKEDLYIEPTILDNVTWSHPVMQEEIFGPILPILEYEDLSKVISKLHEFEKPLALYIFSKDKKVQKRLLSELSFGGGCINATVQHTGTSYLPFGGVGNSGIGKYHGKESFRTFSNMKGILNKSLAIDMKLIYPPFKDKVKLLKKMYN